jgi:flagellar basal body-associated protein FliL
MLKELFSGPIGLMSLAVIVGVIAIGGYFFWFVSRKMAEDEAAANKR